MSSYKLSIETKDINSKDKSVKRHKNNQLENPNVIFIFPDQLGAEVLNCYGNKDVHSPNIDKFAEEGLLFERAYTACPLCTPFRGTVFTGRYPSQTGVTENGLRIPQSEVTVAELFNQAGYLTSYLGKWHLSGQPGGNRPVPPAERAGFQDFTGWESHHVDHWQGLIFTDIDSGFTNKFTDSISAINNDSTTVNDYVNINGCSINGDNKDTYIKIEMEGHETDALTDMVCTKLEEIKDQQFCFFVSYQSPHPPCSPPEKYLDIYRDKDLTYRDNVPEDKPWYSMPHWDCDYDLDTFIRRYYGEITHLDAAFGRLLDKIGETGLDENTIVIFTSDHGDMMGSHGRYSKGVMNEEAIHIPLIIRYPDGRSGRTDVLFSSVDFMPTLLELCYISDKINSEDNGLQEDNDSVDIFESCEGRSYASLVRGEDQKERQFVYVDYKEKCIISDQYKLITDESGGKVKALYNTEDDPYELNNLVENEQFKEIKDRLHRELLTWKDDIDSKRGDIEEASIPFTE